MNKISTTYFNGIENTNFVYIDKHSGKHFTGDNVRFIEYPHDHLMCTARIDLVKTVKLNELTDELTILTGLNAKDKRTALLQKGFIKPYDLVDVLFCSRFDLQTNNSSAYNSFKNTNHV